MSVLAAVHHHGHHKASAHHCGLAIWCHTAPAQAKEYAQYAHLAIAALVVLVVLVLVIAVARRRRKSAKRSTRRPAAYPPSYGGR